MIVLFGALILIGYGFLDVWGKRVHHTGGWLFLWRFLTGHPHHGKYVTDAGWLRDGKRALTKTGHATWWQYLPRWKRTVHRSGGTVAAGLLAWGLLLHTAVTVAVLVVLGTVGLFVGVLLGGRWWKTRDMRRTWLEPLHVAIAPHVGVPLPNPPGRYISIEPDRSKAVIALPKGVYVEEKERKAIESAAVAKLGMSGAETSWALAGPEPKLTLKQTQPAPTMVRLDQVREAIDASRDDELVLGIGKNGAVIKVSLSGDSPHIGVSVASGGGKSALARFIAAQMLHKGCLVIILDIKQISHMWARGLPNVCYARTPDQIHKVLLWLLRELDRRNDVAFSAADIEGEVRANVGPRILVIFEEMNMCMPQLKALWDEIREKEDPKVSPAMTAHEAFVFAGRQVKMNELQIGQRLSAKVSGSGDVRENMAVRMLGRYSSSAWKMLAPEHAMPPSDRHPGRIQVVDHRVRETQVTSITGKEARDLALSGEVAIAPPDMPFVARHRVATGDDGSVISASDQAKEHVAPVVQLRPVALGTLPDDGVHDAPPAGMEDAEVLDVEPAPAAMSLREAVELGVIQGRQLAGVRSARARSREREDDSFPQPVDQAGQTELFEPEALKAWSDRRRR